MFARSKYLRSLAALARGYPSTPSQFSRQYLFSADQRWRNPQTGEQSHHQIREPAVQCVVEDAVRKVRLAKRAPCHTSRHSVATHLLEKGFDIPTVQGLPCPKDVETTMVCTHVLNRRGRGVRSPMDAL
jgi:site-specific recombinase XerD